MAIRTLRTATTLLADLAAPEHDTQARSQLRHAATGKAAQVRTGA